MSKPKVTLTVFGGCVDVEDMDDIEVIVKDYDVENYDSDDKRLKEDKHGKYIERVFGG